jgi:hypothetical protein
MQNNENRLRRQMNELINKCPLGGRVEGCPFVLVSGKPRSIKAVWLEILDEQTMQGYFDHCEKCAAAHIGL